MLKSVTKTQYLENILNGSDIASLLVGDISEISIGKDYAYAIDKNSSFYNINKRLTNQIFEKIPLNNCAIGFRRGFSYYHFLHPHKNHYNFLRLDIKSYFHSLRFETIRRCLSPYFKNEIVGIESKVALIDNVLDFVTYIIPDSAKNKAFRGYRVLPIGFPSSPVISNIVFRQVDIKIQKLCHEMGITYTRYADDLLFSSMESLREIHSLGFENEINSMIAKLSLSLNLNKTIKRRHTISLNGNVIEYGKNGGNIRLSNKKLQLINKFTHLSLIRKESPTRIAAKLFNITFDKHNFKKRPDENFFNKYCRDQLYNKAIGYRCYILSIIQYNKNSSCLEKRYFAKYSKIVDRLNKLIEQYQAFR